MSVELLFSTNGIVVLRKVQYMVFLLWVISITIQCECSNFKVLLEVNGRIETTEISSMDGMRQGIY